MHPSSTEIVGNLYLKEPFFLDAGMTILEAIVAFRREKRHVAMICDDPALAAKYSRQKEYVVDGSAAPAREPIIYGKSLMRGCVGR